MLGHWDEQHIDQVYDAPSIFFRNFLQNLCKNLYKNNFNLFYLFFYDFTKMKVLSALSKKLYKKMLGTSEAWLMSRLSH